MCYEKKAIALEDKLKESAIYFFTLDSTGDRTLGKKGRSPDVLKSGLE